MFRKILRKIPSNFRLISYLTLFAIWGWEWGGARHIVPAADSFVCCGSIRGFEKVKFSENF